MAIATDRAGALGATTSDLEQAGLIFNDAVRLSNGGLWSEPADDNNQLNYASMYEADIGILQQDIASAIANGATVNGVAVTPSNANTLTEIQGQLAALAAAAPNAVGTSDAAVQAQGVLHTDQQLILGEIAGDANLQKALAANGVLNAGTGAVDQGFQALPAQAADSAAAIAAATAGANLSDIGTVFNAATNLADGGLNANNLAQFDGDMKAIAAGLQSFINGAGLAAAEANTAAEQALATADGISLSAAQALTAVHAETILNQVELQINKFDTMYATNPNIAARSTGDNLLDIIDIAQNDPALAASAGNATGTPSHAGGFAEQPGFLTGTGQHYQDNQAQTDFWSAFISGANNINNALTAEANGTVHLDAAGVQSLIQQVQGYQQLGASFDGAQGGIFGARFDNELLGGTLQSDTTTALKALNDIANNGGTVSAADASQLTAAGFGFVADANDVSGNNNPNGGGTYVGTSTTVAGATTTHIADANTTTTGNVDGNEHATANPVDGLHNNGFGVTFPAPAAGGAGTGGGGAAAAIATDRAGALGATTSDLEQAGLIFNDAVRLSNGGLWSQPADSNNQLNYASMYEADIGILQQDIASAIANGATVNGVAVTPSNANTLTEIQGQLAALAAAAPNAVGTSDAAVQAQGVLHTDQQLILGEIAGDANLQKALAANGVLNAGTGAVDQGFQALPAQAADSAAAIAAATAGANLSDIGTVFNAATNLADGGLNANNLAQFDGDMKAIAAGLQSFINGAGLAAAEANTAAEQALATADGISLSAAQALTAVHAETILNQVELQINKFDTMYATNPNIAARSTGDNLLDIIDIAQNDPALAASAGNATGTPSHAGGFAEQPGFLTGTGQHYQDNQAQTDFWSAFISGANNINNALTAEANGTVHLDAAGVQSLIQQVQGYQQLGASFDGAQGGIFGARFDNELLGGTLQSDTTTALKALNDIANNGGTVSAADASQLTAAGFGFVADANDVSGNNNPNGGGTYVGTSTTVAGATTTHIADANTTTTGNVDGNEHATANPVDGLHNNGFGVTFPAPAADGGGNGGGTGAGAGAGGTVVLPTTVRDDALNLSTDLAQAGAVFNDSTRLLDGGLWSTPADSHNQVAYLGMYTTDINAVLDDVNAALANPQGVTVSGIANPLTATDTTVLQQVQGQLQTLLTEAPQSVGNSDAATTAQELIHTTQTSILNEINGDTALAKALGANSYATGTGANNVGFEALPTGSDNADAITAATAQGATLAQIGSVFNAAADLAVGGLNQTNLTEFNADMQAIATGLGNIINTPGALTAIEQAAGETGAAAELTSIHLETVLNQINIQQNSFDALYATNPNIAARSTNDNLLDIIDIVQNDAALNMAAGGNGNAGAVGGFAEFPAYLNGAGGPNAHGGTITQYQDDQAQTNFWAQFIAEGNTINNQLTNVAAGNNTTTGELQALITEIQNYNSFGASFAQNEGGVFAARFANELQGGTLLADTNAAVHGLQGILNGDTGDALAADQAQITAAGQGFVADANDVSGNNIPLGGGSYVGTSTTVAGATSVAGIAQGTIPVGGAASGATGGGGNNQGQNGGQDSSPPANQQGNQGSQANNGDTGDNGNQAAQGNNGNSGANGDQGHPGDGQSGNSGGSMLSGNVATDLASLIQAIQNGNKTAIITALTSLEGDFNGNGGNNNNGSNGNKPAGGNAAGNADNNGQAAHDPCGGCGNDAHHDHHHFEMMWHHA